MYRREIGSEFHICGDHETKAPVHNIFDYLKDFNVSFFDSGRSALKLLLEQVKHNKVLLPGYICESVRFCFADACDVTYYGVNSDMKIDWNDLLEKCSDDVDVVYLHYFNGYVGQEYDFEALLQRKQQCGFVIIEDTTHSLFSTPHTVGDYCFSSLRKWFPIADGGVLYAKDTIPCRQLPQNTWAESKRRAMVEKGNYLSGLINDKQSFMRCFHDAENILDNQASPFSISAESLVALHSIDCQEIIAARRKNYAFLQNAITCKNTAFGGMNQVPLFFTISVEDRDRLREYLTNHDIYCPVHWPLFEELKHLDAAVYNYEHELSIPIDQRYDEEDMACICACFRSYAEQGVTND